MSRNDYYIMFKTHFLHKQTSWSITCFAPNQTPQLCAHQLWVLAAVPHHLSDFLFFTFPFNNTWLFSFTGQNCLSLLFNCLAISEWIMGPQPHQTLLVLIHTKPGSVNDAQSVTSSCVFVRLRCRRLVWWAGAAVMERVLQEPGLQLCFGQKDCHGP